MRTLYIYIPETLADWEPGHVIAELCSGRYLKDRSLRYNAVLCGLTVDSITTMGGLHLQPDTLISDIRPGGDGHLAGSGTGTGAGKSAQDP